MAEVWIHDRKTCGCVRCVGFQKGNTVSAGSPRDHLAKHGAYKSPLVLAPEAEAIAEMVRPLLPVWQPGFEGTLQSYCISLARIQRASDALAKAESLPEGEDPGFSVMALSENLRRWQASARTDADALGLTPKSAARIMKDASEGFLAQQQGLLTQKELDEAPSTALEQALTILRSA